MVSEQSSRTAELDGSWRDGEMSLDLSCPSSCLETIHSTPAHNSSHDPALKQTSSALMPTPKRKTECPASVETRRLFFSDGGQIGLPACDMGQKP